MSHLSRRTFLQGVLTVAVATAIHPAIVKALPVIYGDGVHDDTAGLNALLSGKALRTVDGFAGIARSGTLIGGKFRMTDTLHVWGDGVTVADCRFLFDFASDAPLSKSCLVFHAGNSTLDRCTFDSIGAPRNALEFAR